MQTLPGTCETQLSTLKSGNSLLPFLQIDAQLSSTKGKAADSGQPREVRFFLLPP